jgi:magnesium chelatase family protein
VSRYQAKLSGPLMDRIDLHVDVQALVPDELLQAPAGDSSAAVRGRATAARQRAWERQGCTNQALSGSAIDTHVQLEDSASRLVASAAAQLGWSARGTHRTLKIARTIADLAGAAQVQVLHLAEAMQYRRMAVH